MKYFKLIPIFFIVLFFSIGCATIQIGQPEKEAAFETLGYNAAYWPLKNNPDYIQRVEVPLQVAIETVNTEDVDIALLMSDIVEFIVEMRLNPEFDEYGPPLVNAMKQFQGLLIMDLDIPEEYEEAVTLTRAFLVGAQDAIKDLKGV